MIHFGFSYIGLAFLLMLFIPNIIWTKHKPKDYENYVVNENKILLLFERIGEILVCVISLIFSDFNLREANLWSVWLVLAVLAMIFYEGYWIRYFCSEQQMTDFYSSFLGIPVAGASLPVVAFSFWKFTVRTFSCFFQPLFWELVILGFIYHTERKFRTVRKRKDLFFGFYILL